MTAPLLATGAAAGVEHADVAEDSLRGAVALSGWETRASVTGAAVPTGCYGCGEAGDATRQRYAAHRKFPGERRTVRCGEGRIRTCVDPRKDPTSRRARWPPINHSGHLSSLPTPMGFGPVHVKENDTAR
ncbi:hypothetical protein SGPA1_40170 [Streptomyces misionensis JCM 4497]